MLKKIGDVVLFKLSDSDSNIYLLGDSVIDSGTGFNLGRLNTMLRMQKKALGDIKEVVNTHEHFDHFGGNGYFLNAKIRIHEDGAPVLENADMKRSLADYFDGQLKPKRVDQKLKEGDVVEAGGLKLEVIHTPGHSPGSICLYDKKQKLLFSGDTVFSEGVGRTDLPGSDPQKLKASLEKLQNLEVEKILPGHGEPRLEGGDKVLKEVREMVDWV